VTIGAAYALADVVGGPVGAIFSVVTEPADLAVDWCDGDVMLVAVALVKVVEDGALVVDRTVLGATVLDGAALDAATGEALWWVPPAHPADTTATTTAKLDN
jgi:hypothetical protein